MHTLVCIVVCMNVCVEIVRILATINDGIVAGVGAMCIFSKISQCKLYNIYSSLYIANRCGRYANFYLWISAWMKRGNQ